MKPLCHLRCRYVYLVTIINLDTHSKLVVFFHFIVIYTCVTASLWWILSRLHISSFLKSHLKGTYQNFSIKNNFFLKIVEVQNWNDCP